MSPSLNVSSEETYSCRFPYIKAAIYYKTLGQGVRFSVALTSSLLLITWFHTHKTDVVRLTLLSTAPRCTIHSYHKWLQWEMNASFFPLNYTGLYQSGCQERARSLKPETDRLHVFLLLIVRDLIKRRQRGFRQA